MNIQMSGIMLKLFNNDHYNTLDSLDIEKYTLTQRYIALKVNVSYTAENK